MTISLLSQVLYADSSYWNNAQSNRKNNDTPEVVSKTILQDVLSEGPIEGLCDEKGNSINFINTTNNDQSNLGYGIRYNDLPIKDKKSKKFNVPNSNFDVDLGNEYNKKNHTASTVYEYRQKIYDLPKGVTYQPGRGSDNFVNFNLSLSEIQEKNPNLENIRQNYSTLSHKVRNKYASRFRVNVSISDLYLSDTDGISSSSTRICVGAFNSSTNKFSYYHGIYQLLVKGSPFILQYEIILDKSDFEEVPFPEITLFVFSTNPFLSASDNTSRNMSLDSVIEYVDNIFSYPYIANVVNVINSKFSSSIPSRAYDCKLLKMKVPDNYDADIREYNGDWSGNFSRTLKWTDDPAWIFYDLCSNTRYGLARGSLSENDIDKWNFYSISKFCNVLVKNETETRFPYQEFTFSKIYDDTNSLYNCITITTSDSLATLREKYPEGSILYLYDLKNSSNENISENYKKIIYSVSTNGTTATIRLINNFSPRKFIENDSSGRFYDFYSKQSAYPDLGMEDDVAIKAFKYIKNVLNLNFDSSSELVSQKYINDVIFDENLDISTGKCVAKHDNYPEFLEPRFSSSFLINSETEALKIITDLATVFRGNFYFKNGSLIVNTDVKKPVSYLFSNSNVKEGFFSYTSSSMEGVYTVAKVSYIDKNNNFKDSIVYAEDSSLISKYGIIERDIIGFGITSKQQAYRLGKWFLATNKLESDVVNFSTGIESYLLNPGDIIRIADNLKTEKVFYGKIISIDFLNSYLTLDREVPQNCIGKKIRITIYKNQTPEETFYYISEVDNKNLRIKIQTTPFISWNVVRNIVVDSQNYLSKSSSSGNAWNSKAYSDQSYIKNCELSWSNVYLTDFDMVGLSSEVRPTDTEYSNINYAIYSNGSSLQIYENGTNISISSTTVSTEDILKIKFENGYIRYYKNDELIREVARTSSDPLYAVVALNNSFAAVKNIKFGQIEESAPGLISDLRHQLNFAIYLEEEIQESDLYRIISISEASENEMSISALKYSKEKFDFIELDKYVDNMQTIKKQIPFSTDAYIYTAFTDAEITTINASTSFLASSDINIQEALDNDYDYQFNIEREYLDSSYTQSVYKQLTINFSSLFDDNKIKNNDELKGLLCKIRKNGKSLTFKVDKTNRIPVKIFLGQTAKKQVSFVSDYEIDFYAYDINGRLFNV